MASLFPFVTARDLLNQVVDALQVKPEQSHLEQPCDCEYMSLLTEATNPFPLHLVNGADYLGWVSKHAYYNSLGLEMRTAILCLESRPITHLLSLISRGSGIPQADLQTLSVCREHFGALNRGLEQLFVANPLFYESPRLDLNELIALIRRLKRHEAIETVIIDALHHVRFEGDKPATRSEQSLISSVLKSTAHVGQLHIVAGFYDPQVEFPEVSADSVLYCGPGDETTKAEPRRIAIAGFAMATIRCIRAVCRSLTRITPLLFPYVLACTSSHKG